MKVARSQRQSWSALEAQPEAKLERSRSAESQSLSKVGAQLERREPKSEQIWAQLEQSWSAVKMQSKCSQSAVIVQSECSRSAVKVQSGQRVTWSATEENFIRESNSCFVESLMLC